MLVLTRKVDESIEIGSEIKIAVVRISPGKVRIGIDAPRSLNIKRSELPDLETRSPPGVWPGGVSVVGPTTEGSAELAES